MHRAPLVRTALARIHTGVRSKQPRVGTHASRASSSTSSHTVATPNRRLAAPVGRRVKSLSERGATAGVASLKVCPCCLGAVHKPSRAALDPALTPFFRSFSKMAATTTSTQSVVAIVLAEHRKAEQDFAAYERATDKAEKTRIARQLIKDISQHGACEEMSIYPWMKERDPSVKDLVDHGIHEHVQLKKDLDSLDSMDVDDSRFVSTLARCWADLSHHVKEEETSILPKLEKMATPAELAQLASKFMDLKAIAPTHPHPMGPTSGGVFTKAMNAGTAMMDKARDAVRDATTSTTATKN